MKKAIVVHHSRTGTTEALADVIATQIAATGFDVKTCSIAEANPAELASADSLLFGCWTRGLLIALQHPEEAWKQFVQALPPAGAGKVGLFTTYKVATGGMFKKMAACLENKAVAPTLTIKSRNASLGEKDQRALAEWLAQ
jgi:flavodoxin